MNLCIIFIESGGPFPSLLSCNLNMHNLGLLNRLVLGNTAAQRPISQNMNRVYVLQYWNKQNLSR